MQKFVCERVLSEEKRDEKFESFFFSFTNVQQLVFVTLVGSQTVVS